MLDAGSHCCRVGEILALIALDHGNTHLCIEIRILTRTLCHTAPARITRHIEHRRECPSHARSSRLYSSHARSLLHYSRIESSCLSERNREYGTETMDHVTSHQNRYSETALLDGSLLHLIDFCRIHTIQYRTHFSFGSLVHQPCTA